eukprot:gene30819-35855_t
MSEYAAAHSMAACAAPVLATAIVGSGIVNGFRRFSRANLDKRQAREEAMLAAGFNPWATSSGMGDHDAWFIDKSDLRKAILAGALIRAGSRASLSSEHPGVNWAKPPLPDLPAELSCP